MDLVNSIINDCEVLKRMTFIKPPKIGELNAIFDNTEFKNVVARITPLYLGIYPRDPKEGGNLLKLIQLIKDADYLESGKRFYLLVLLHFYADFKMLKEIVKTFNNSTTFDYQSLKFMSTLKDTCMASSLIDILILNKYTFTGIEFDHTCLHSNTDTLKYIYGLGGINIHGFYGDDEDAYYDEFPFQMACRSGDLEKAQWIFNVGLIDETRGGRKINFHGTQEMPFQMACFSGNLKLVKWLWNIGVYYDSIKDTLPFNDRLINIKIRLNIERKEFILQFVLLSDNLELLEWFLLLRAQEGIRVWMPENMKRYSERVRKFVSER